MNKHSQIPGLLFLGGGRPEVAALCSRLTNEPEFALVPAGETSLDLAQLPTAGVFAALVFMPEPDGRADQHAGRLPPGFAVPRVLLVPGRGADANQGGSAGRDGIVACHSLQDLDYGALVHDLRLLCHAWQATGGQQDEQTLLLKVMDQLADCVLLIDARSGRIIHANVAAERLFGRSTANLAGEQFGFPLVEGESTEIDILQPDGAIRTAEMRLRHTFLRGDNLLMASLRDITPRKTLERRLQEAYRTAEQASHDRDDFLAHISHDIRTPMSGIIGMVELAMVETRPERQKKHLEVIKGSAESLLHIFNDLLDLSRIESGRLELRQEPFPLRRLLEPLLAGIAAQCREKGLQFETGIGANVPEQLVGDAAKLRRVLENLLGNAVKHTAQGSVSFRADVLHTHQKLAQPSAGTALLRFVVEATGQGMDAELQDDAGRRNLREHAAHHDLGLNIVRHLTDCMGGSLDEAGHEGQGNSVTISIPFRHAVEVNTLSPGPCRNHPALEPLDVLLVEDNEVNQLFTSEMLANQGHRVTVRENGQAALDILSRKRFDLILMDIQMPVLDGVETTRRIRDRASPVLDHRVPIIALTAHALKGDRERFLAEGLDDYITKPVDFAQLVQAMAKLLPGKVQRDAAQPQSAAEPPASAAQDTAVIDQDWFTRMFSSRKDFLRRMFEVFLREEPLRLAKIRTAVQSRDMEALRILAHSLKGAAATLGAAATKEQAFALERAAADNDAELAESACRKLEVELQRVLDFMQQFITTD